MCTCWATEVFSLHSLQRRTHTPAIILHYTALHCTTVHCTVVHCTVLQWNALNCFIMQSISVHCTVCTHCSAQCTNVNTLPLFLPNSPQCPNMTRGSLHCTIHTAHSSINKLRKLHEQTLPDATPHWWGMKILSIFQLLSSDGLEVMMLWWFGRKWWITNLP